jgi:hypothetical protein
MGGGGPSGVKTERKPLRLLKMTDGVVKVVSRNSIWSSFQAIEWIASVYIGIGIDILKICLWRQRYQHEVKNTDDARSYHYREGTIEGRGLTQHGRCRKNQD